MHTVTNRSLQSHLEGVEGLLLHDEPMDRHTSWRVGGKAEMFYVPTDKASLVQLMCQLPGNVPVFWFGLGSNLLVRDAGIPGMVVCTFKGMDEIERVDKESVYAQAGVASAKHAKFCARRGLEGAEFLAGIPGSFGGAVAMNAGAFGGDTWSMIERIECLDREGNITWFEKSEISYQYRYVDLPQIQSLDRLQFNMCTNYPVIFRQILERTAVQIQRILMMPKMELLRSTLIPCHL